MEREREKKEGKREAGMREKEGEGGAERRRWRARDDSPSASGGCETRGASFPGLQARYRGTAISRARGERPAAPRPLSKGPRHGDRPFCGSADQRGAMGI